ncbi:MAG: cyclase family protein [Bacteroidia bacterium]|nr:cyclase family protein [Bacteroidia bacterium]
MKLSVTISGRTFQFDSAAGTDISIPLRAADDNITAWHVSPPRFEPVRMGNWVGDVNHGASVNFRDIFFNPHGHGTHTECVGHISRELFTINQCLKEFIFLCEVVSITPEKKGDDLVITESQVKRCRKNRQAPAFAIRTRPNSERKLRFQYTGTNPAYLHPEAIALLVEQGVEHLLIDTPSVDKEEDGGQLLAHRAFWEYPANTQSHRTITELIYIPDTVPDGTYLLHLHIASFENDASPAKPVLYHLAQ